MCIVLNTKCGGEVRSLERVNSNNQKIFPGGLWPISEPSSFHVIVWYWGWGVQKWMSILGVDILGSWYFGSWHFESWHSGSWRFGRNPLTWSNRLMCCVLAQNRIIIILPLTDIPAFALLFGSRAAVMDSTHPLHRANLRLLFMAWTIITRLFSLFWRCEKLLWGVCHL